MNILWIVVIAIIVLRIGWRVFGKSRKATTAPAAPKKPLSPWQRKWYTIWTFFTINIKRLFRDRLALFFTFLFPLIFLFVFGGLNSGGNSISFKIAVINESKSPFAKQFVAQLEKQKAFKVSDDVTTFKLANEKIILKNQILDSFYKAGTLSPESFRTIMKHRDLSNAINNTSRKIYASRQRLLDSLSVSINNSGRRAQRWGIIMIVVVLASGAVLFWYIISRIRRQNHLIQELDASEKKVREVSLIKENFMANMSHEIRTPMNAILGFTNLLKARNRDPELAEFIESIQKSGENLLTIINDILDLSKIEAGMIRIESTPFSIRGLIHSIQTLFAEKINEKRLQFSTAIDDSIPDTLSGDATVNCFLMVLSRTMFCRLGFLLARRPEVVPCNEYVVYTLPRYIRLRMPTT